MSDTIQKNSADNYARHSDQSLTTYDTRDVKTLIDTHEFLDKLPINGSKAVQDMDLSEESIDSLMRLGDNFGLADMVDGKAIAATGDYTQNTSKLDTNFKERVSYIFDDAKDTLRGIDESYHKWTDNLGDSEIGFKTALAGTMGSMAGMGLAVYPVPGIGSLLSRDLATGAGVIAAMTAFGAGSGLALAISDNKDKNERIMYELENRPFLEKVGAIPKQE